MSKFFKRYFFLLAAAISLLLAVGFYYADKESITDESYLHGVEVRLQKEIEQAQESIAQVAALLPATDKPFSTLLVKSNYPYFVYQDSTLLMWSDNRLITKDYLQNQPLSPLVPFESSQGKFIQVSEQKKIGETTYRIFAFIKLYSLFKNQTTNLPSGYNPQIFRVSPALISLKATSGKGAIRAKDGQVLFYTQPPTDPMYRHQMAPFQTLLWVSLAILFLGIYMFVSVRYFRIRHRYGLGLGLLVFFIVLVRGLMLRFSIPFAFYEGKVFNPQYYQGSFLAPSLGDLLLNCLSVGFVMVYINSVYFRTVTYRRLTRSGIGFQAFFSCLILLVGYVAYYMCYRELVNIYEKSFFTLDITLSISFSALKFTSLLIFIILSGIYFLVINLVTSVFIRLNPELKIGLAILAGSFLLTVLLAWLLRIPFEWIFLVHVGYVLVLYLSRLPRAFFGFRYATTVYYFVGALACAILTTYVVEIQESKKDVLNKKEFGAQLLSEHDLFTEFLLKKSSDLIAADTQLKSVFAKNPPLAREIIQQRIRNKYLDQYQNRYEVEIFSFDKTGNPLDSQAGARSWNYYQEKYNSPANATEYASVFLVRDTLKENLKQYAGFVTLRQEDEILGYVLLNLCQRGENTHAQYPDLLLDEQFVQAPETREYSYAIFEKESQMYSSGAYNYERKFPSELLSDSALYIKGKDLHGFRHVGQAGSDQRSIVVSSKSWEWRGMMANFSFLFLILVLVVTVAIVGHALRYGFSALPLTYSTKIQVLLNAAFILPLLLILFLILRVIGSNYEENQQDTYLKVSQNISANVLSYMEDFKEGKMSEAYLEQQIAQIARDADLEINLYDTTGYLLLSSKPLIYQSGLLSELINPSARKQIIEQKETQVLLNESLGSMTYSTAFAGLKSFDQELLGVVGIPFFDSKPSLERQIIEIVASLLIVFTGMLLIFLLVSYWAAHLLIVPLRVLTRRISTTNLNQLNEPLPWKSNDEIGTLIKKYNQMLVNLEQNKQVLSTTEKQSAWREMARQVAHEIKNPLTPMKLTLQQLQRTIRRDDPEALEKVSKAMGSIIDQIDNIGHIAQSFSDIARMPPPQKEVFEVTSVLNKAYELYASDRNITFNRDVQAGPLYVKGDRKQFGASVTNLIINAKQSVPEGRPAVIGMKLYVHKEAVMIEIQDNGSGISPTIKNRVFLPNFTTRVDGSGLGLAMAKRIIEHAGGSIWFETEVDKGTTFFLSIPLEKTEDAAPKSA
ncbi:sensor histidine kinase [Arundinibacter roseus]|uniref:histidine kinase n=1 Tax=Arundinibacter roseus TaxID=2070510 RepID=A0A4R4K1I7_9BACT|nr:HAMP domain-containing sensor histidine kinase [Arundinibacter roseus]TDB61174.1 HAMP domain-containing histidine kinase [Arundinibacter roseus]